MQFYEREIRCVYLVVVIGAGMKVVGGCCLVDLFCVKFSRHGWSIVMLLTSRFRTKHYTAANLMFFGSPEDHNTLLSHVAYVWLSSLQILLELCGWVLYIRVRWMCSFTRLPCEYVQQFFCQMNMNMLSSRLFRWFYLRCNNLCLIRNKYKDISNLISYTNSFPCDMSPYLYIFFI